MSGLKTGAAWCPIDPCFPLLRRRNLIARTGASVVLTNSDSPQDKYPNVSCLDVSEALLGPPTHQRKSIGKDDLAYLIWTSGTTGEPKGVEILSQGIMCLANNTNVIQLKRKDRIAQVAAPSFDVSLLEIWATLVVGCTIVIVSQDTLMDPLALYKTLQHQRITGIIMTPTLLQWSLAGTRTVRGRPRPGKAPLKRSITVRFAAGRLRPASHD